MRVLITGGCGFIGSHVVERFYKEGHKIYIIDDLSTGKREHIDIKHKFYRLDISDKKCEEIFKLHNFDIVVNFAAQVDVNISQKNCFLDTKTNILGLVNMLYLSSKYGVKKFIFLSSAAIYGDNDSLPANEETVENPLSVYGINKALGEYYCRRWQELYGLDTKVFRLSNVYGPRQDGSIESGVISIFLKNSLDEKEIVVYGDGNQTRDFIFVEDVADAIYKSATTDKHSSTLNISSNSEHSLKELLNIIEDLKTLKEIKYQEKRNGDINRSRLDNTKIKNELDWKPKYSLKEGILKTFQWYEKNKNGNIEKDEKVLEKKWHRKINKNTRPYVENILLFLLLAFISKYLQKNTINGYLGIDYCFIYIAIMGMFYGKKQSLIATVFSSLLFVNGLLNKGMDFVSIIYQSEYLIHLVTYLLIGIVTGYTSDKKVRKIHAKELEYSYLSQRYEFLEEMYIEANQVKNELQLQIIDTDDSFGKIYNLVKQLESLDIENIFNAAIEVIEKIIKSDKIAIYTVNQRGDYLRLKNKSKQEGFEIPFSIKLEEFAEIKRIVSDKRTFVNKELKEQLPIMAAPIIFKEKVIAVVVMYELEFEKLTLYRENLFRMTVWLITDALTKAYLYDESRMEKIYIKNTKILQTEEFQKVVNEIRKRDEKFNLKNTLLKVEEKELNYQEVHKKLKGIIRNEDYVGLGNDGHLFILLLNTNQITSELVIERLKMKDIYSARVSGE